MLDFTVEGFRRAHIVVRHPLLFNLNSVCVEREVDLPQDIQSSCVMVFGVSISLICAALLPHYRVRLYLM